MHKERWTVFSKSCANSATMDIVELLRCLSLVTSGKAAAAACLADLGAMIYRKMRIEAYAAWRTLNWGRQSLYDNPFH